MSLTGNTKWGSITVPLTSYLDWFGISCMTADKFCSYLQNRLIQTSQTGGQQYRDTSLFSIPCLLSQRLLWYSDHCLWRHPTQHIVSTVDLLVLTCLDQLLLILQTLFTL
jgi:hypothetical protein